MSFYLSHPDVPAAKVNAYPKRRRKQPDVILFPNLRPTPAVPAADLRYQDFFTPEVAKMGRTA